MCKLFQKEEIPYGRIKEVVRCSDFMEMKKVANSSNQGHERKETMRYSDFRVNQLQHNK